MNISYSIYTPPKRGGGRSEETLAISAFIKAKNKENMCFEYEDAVKAKRKMNTVISYKNKSELMNLIDVYRVENRIYIIKKEGSKKNGNLKDKQA